MLLLCVIITFSCVCIITPQEVTAATAAKFTGIASTELTKEVNVCMDEEYFYAGDYIIVWDKAENYDILSNCSNVTYKSSNPSVAKINSNSGKMNLKKEGTTTITAKYKGKTAKYSLRVIDKKEMKKVVDEHKYKDDGIEAATVEEYVLPFIEKVGENPTIKKSNRYNLLAAYKSYEYKDYYFIGIEGYDLGVMTKYDESSKKNIDYVYLPEAARARAICNKFEKYAMKYQPLRPDTKHSFKIKKISGKANSKKITIKLKSKVTEDQLFGANYQFSWDTDVKKTKTYILPIMVQEKKNDYKYYAHATIKQGSDTITIDTRNLKLKKGVIYKLLDKEATWFHYDENKDTFKVN